MFSVLSSTTLPNSSNISTPTNSESSPSSLDSKKTIEQAIVPTRPCKIDFRFMPLLRQIPSFFSHRLESDLLLYDRAQRNERGEIRGLLSNYNTCKRILSVCFDSLTGMSTVRVETCENIPFTPFGLMVDRLESQNDKNAYKLSKMIARMGQFINETRESCGFNGVGLRKAQRTDPRFREYQQRNKEYMAWNSENLLIDFVFRFSKRSNDFEVAEINFNEKFREVVGLEDSSEFSKTLLKKGFPDAIFFDENYHSWYSKMVANSFIRVMDPKTPKEPMEIMVQTVNNEKECFDMDVEMNSLELEGFFEITMHIAMAQKKNKLQLMKRKQKEMMVFEEIRNAKAKEDKPMMVYTEPVKDPNLLSSKFVSSFYPDALVKKRRVEPKECGYKLL